jgi:hypothetical protein
MKAREAWRWSAWGHFQTHALQQTEGLLAHQPSGTHNWSLVGPPAIAAAEGSFAIFVQVFR